MHLADDFIIIFSAVTAIDTSGIDAVCEIRKMLQKRSLKVKRKKVMIAAVSEIPEFVGGSHLLCALYAACVGKSCWKCNGKARSLTTLGLLPFEWTLPLCWRSCGSYLFFVVSSAMTCKLWQSEKRTFLLFYFSRVYLKAVKLIAFSFFLFLSPFSGKNEKLCSSKKRF